MQISAGWPMWLYITTRTSWTQLPSDYKAGWDCAISQTHIRFPWTIWVQFGENEELSNSKLIRNIKCFLYFKKLHLTSSKQIRVPLWEVPWRCNVGHIGQLRPAQSGMIWLLMTCVLVVWMGEHRQFWDTCKTNLLQLQTLGVLWHSVPSVGLPLCNLWLHCSCGGDSVWIKENILIMQTWFNGQIVYLQKEVEAPGGSSTRHIGWYTLVESPQSLMLPDTLHAVQYASIFGS